MSGIGPDFVVWLPKSGGVFSWVGTLDVAHQNDVIDIGATWSVTY